MRRYGYDGDPDANGEFYLVRDVGDIEDRLADALRKLAAATEVVRVTDERYQILLKKTVTQFGYVDPVEAGVFLHSQNGEIVVTRNRTHSKVMPISFTRGPRKFRLPGDKRPSVKARVYVDGEKGRVIAYSKAIDKGVIVKLDSGEKVETINWSLVNDTKRNATRGAGIDGDGAGCGDLSPTGQAVGGAPA